MTLDYKKIKIIIADDHDMIIQGIRTLLNNNSDFEIIHSVNNGLELIEILKVFLPDIILLDVDMPKMTGIEAAKIIKKEYPEIKIIILTVHDEAGMIHKFREIGVDGYLLKNISQHELITALKVVHSGKKTYSSEVTEVLISENTKKQKNTLSLTEREIEILKLIAEGFSNTEIGEKLFISHRTVDTHRTNLMKKIEVNNIAGLIKFALTNGYVD